MDEKIWVEIVSRHREVAARHRCAGPIVRIGRGYDNDLVIDDPYVAPQHLVIRRDPLTGGLVAEDQGSANGLFAGEERQRVERISLDGEHLIRIGRTYLRIRDTDHPVTPERFTTNDRRRWPLLLGLFLAAPVIVTSSYWLRDYGEPKLSHFLAPLLLTPLLLLAWTAGWSVLSRIFTGEARFERNLAIALTALLGLSLLDEVADFAGFSLGWRLVRLVELAMWGILGLACFFHLRTIGPGWAKLKGGAVAALVALAIAIKLLGWAETQATVDAPGGFQHPLPSALHLAPIQSGDAFFAAAAQLKPMLDRAREEKPSGFWLPDLGRREE